MSSLLPGYPAQGEGAWVFVWQERRRADAGKQAKHSDQRAAEQARGTGRRLGD
jgi:hypothetical protein